jgi:hypothetical protein
MARLVLGRILTWLGRENQNFPPLSILPNGLFIKIDPCRIFCNDDIYRILTILAT